MTRLSWASQYYRGVPEDMAVDPDILQGIGRVLDGVGISHPGVLDLADTPAAARFRRRLMSDPSNVVDIDVARGQDGNGLIVMGASPDDDTPPTEGCEIPTDEQMTHLAAYAPTGTVADALHAREAIQGFLIRKHQSVAGFLQNISEYFTPTMPPQVALSIYAGWLAAACYKDSPLIYVAPELVDTLVDAASSMPEIGDIPSLRLPMDGMIVLGKPIGTGFADEADGIDRWIEGFTGAKHPVLTWATYPPDATEASGSYLLQVTPWARVGTCGAGFLHGDVLKIRDRFEGAEVISGPLGPNCPTWIDGDYPRDPGKDHQGREFGWQGRQNFYIRFVAALALWLQQEVVRQEDAMGELPRAERRRWQRAKVGSGRVTTIKLRRLEGTGRTSEEFGGERTYTKQWFVRGHWRTYWTGIGRTVPEPRWISRYIAGPEDMPLDAGSEAVWKVDR